MTVEEAIQIKSEDMNIEEDILRLQAEVNDMPGGDYVQEYYCATCGNIFSAGSTCMKCVNKLRNKMKDDIFNSTNISRDRLNGY